MRHVDALSRNLPSVLAINDGESVTTRLSKAQRCDEHLKPIFDALLHGAYDNFVVQNDILYKKCGDDLFFVVPKAMQHEVISRTHDVGHFAINKVERTLKKEFLFPRMKARIERVIRNCVAHVLAECKLGKEEGWLYSIPKRDTPLNT